jgi:hypothetical protein
VEQSEYSEKVKTLIKYAGEIVGWLANNHFQFKLRYPNGDNPHEAKSCITLIPYLNFKTFE